MADRLYPELEGRGLYGAVRVELDALGSEVQPSRDPQTAYSSSMSRGERDAYAYVSAGERSFGLDLWCEGVRYLVGWSGELTPVAAAIDFWLCAADADGETTATRFPFLKLFKFAVAYDRGEAIEVCWQNVLSDPCEANPLWALSEAAATEPRLRRLRPYRSVDSLRFSRWVGYPFSDDLPWAPSRVTMANALVQFAGLEPRDPRWNTYSVHDANGRLLGEGGAAHAVELLVDGLPQHLDVLYRKPPDKQR